MQQIDQEEKQGKFLRIARITAIAVGTCVCTYSVYTCMRQHRYVKLLKLLSQP